MNRRSFLSFFALAPIATVTVGEAAAKAMTVIGIDGGGADELMGVAVLTPIKLRAGDIEFIERRTFSVDEICRFYSCRPGQLGAIELRGRA
jgi:hypothetical protein